jgi:hypothetical protein
VENNGPRGEDGDGLNIYILLSMDLRVVYRIHNKGEREQMEYMTNWHKWHVWHIYIICGVQEENPFPVH